MGRRVAFTGLLLAAIAILFLCFNSPASAVEPVPGNACGTGGNITNSKGSTLIDANLSIRSRSTAARAIPIGYAVTNLG